jgi:hypothetical protein
MRLDILMVATTS